MTIKGIQAWVTSATDEKTTTKSLVLAASLRRVRTGKKLVVFTSALTEDMRVKLEAAFDLVVPIEKTTLGVFKVEDLAKMQAFSLSVFSKCVFLAPQMMVVKNCDNLFEKYGFFAISQDKDEIIDTSVFLFTPSPRVREELTKIAEQTLVQGDFSQMFTLWLENHVPNYDNLGMEYNMKLHLNNSNSQDRLDRGVIIVNFVDAYPLDFSQDKVHYADVVQFVTTFCWTLYKSAIAASDLKAPPSPLCETEPIAIVGLNFRLPGGNTPEEFWDLLAQGQEASKTLPPFRWTKTQSSTPCTNRNIQAGFLTIPIDEFDSKFFGISRKDMVYLDPQQRLLHEVSWHALEDAGIDPHTLHLTNSGIFVGSWLQNYRNMLTRSAECDFYRAYLGTSFAAMAARLAHFFGTTGPTISSESGCSSGIVAVDMACKSLRNHDSNLALACGVNLILDPFDEDDFSFVVSPDGRCKTFDSKADGFGRAEGCAVLVLKRLSDAIREENKIWGLVRGSAIVQEGASNSLGTPTIHCESLAMKLAMEEAGVEPNHVSYIEAHGTGTPVGDPLEIEAIAKHYSSTKRTEPLVIGSVKTNVGHTESVSGLTGIIKVLLSLKHEAIPRHLNFETLNPEINLDTIPAKIPLQSLPWRRQVGKPRLAGVSSFGISGTDGHVLIEEAPLLPNSRICSSQFERPLHLMKISAKSSESLQKWIEIYSQTFAESSEIKFEEYAFSANTGRATFNHRAAIIAKDLEDAGNQLKANSFRQAEITSSQTGTICFLFTGQGSQYPNMASTLYSTSPIFRSHFDECCSILETRYNIPLKRILWGNSSSENLSDTVLSQTSIFCVEYCLFKLWESWGVKPDFVLGHSLGEFAAAVASHALRFEDALMLVTQRSRLIDNLPRGKMLVLGGDQEEVDEQVTRFKEIHSEFWVDYAALNSPEQTVVAGNSGFIEDFAQFCKGNGLKAAVLGASHAFHSRHLDPILEEYGLVASSIKTKAKTTRNFEDDAHAPKYISGTEGRLIDIQDIGGDYWLRHTREKVNFIEACKAVHSQGCRLFLEIGPHPVLSSFAMMNKSEGSAVKCFPSLRRNEDDWTTLMSSVANLYLSDWKGQIDWNGFDLGYPRERVDLPLYPFDRKATWVKFRRPSSELHPLLGTIFPTPANVSLFEREMTVKNTSFVKDHVIGSTIVFPGAAFLEMALAAGHASVQGLTEEWTMPRRGIGLKNLKIINPLALPELEHCIIQTIVTLDDSSAEEKELSYPVSIYHNSDPASTTEGKWILHASGTFQPVVQMNETEKLLPPDFHIPTIQTLWKEAATKPFYEDLHKLGLRFGPKFLSLQRGWMSEAGLLVQIKVPKETESAGYLIHPVVGDAMMQAMGLWESTDEVAEGAKMKLQVPVAIRHFSWLRNVDVNDSCYIYTSSSEEGEVYSILLDEQGTALAHMRGVDFAKTTAKMIEEIVDQNVTPLPGLWEEVWKPKNSSDQFRVHLDEVHYPTRLSGEVEGRLRQLNDIGSEERTFWAMLTDLAHNYVLKALYKLGWTPDADNNLPHQFTMDIFDTLSITKSSYKNHVSFFLRPLATEGTSPEILEFFSPPPSMEECLLNIQKIGNSVDKSRMEYKVTTEVGEILHEILTGVVNPLTILFPENPSKPNVREFYGVLGKIIYPVLSLTFDSFYIDTIVNAMEEQERNHGDQGVLQILEVGAGTGAFTRNFIESLHKKEVKFEYTYTDISASFFVAAEKEFEHLGGSMIFKKFDMEKDPFEQGFSPEYFDVVVAGEALHLAKDTEKTIKNLRDLLRPNGMVLALETIQQVPPYTFVWGLLEGYWRFEEPHLRNLNITLPAEKWVELFQSAEFDRVEWRPAKDEEHAAFLAFASRSRKLHDDLNLFDNQAKHTWLIFDDESDFTAELQRKLVQVKRKVVVFPKPIQYSEETLKEELNPVIREISDSTNIFEGIVYLWGLVGASSERDQARISLPMLSLCQLLINYEQAKTRVYMVTQGMYKVEDSEVLNPACGTLRGILGGISGEKHFHITHMDLSPAEAVTCQVDQVFTNLWGESNEICARRDGKWLLPKLAPLKIANDYLPLPNGCERFQLQLPSTKLFSDLEFTFLDEYTLEGNQVEVEVKACSLNFRDLFAVLKPSSDFDSLNALASDLAGVVSKIGSRVTTRKVGDRVIVLNPDENMSLPSHVKISEMETIPLPKNITFAEGSTFPAVVATVHHCLVTVGKVQQGESLLIHTASGGVGLCAIQLAGRLIGAKIIATAGSSRKRNFLRSLGITHVFHSRTTEFSKQILEVTNGKGVDVVLNSLTGPGFKEASLECLAKNGRFIEMSKLNKWTVEEVQQLRPDVSYSAVDLMKLSSEENNMILQQISGYLANGLLKPIPYDRFDALNIRGALNYLQQAKHIGKVVCVMPEVKVEKGKFVVKTPLFNDESTYIVTGGLGGIGFEVVKWMLESGAKHIVILSRSQPRPDMASTIESWNNTSGKHVKACSVDVGNLKELQQIFELVQLPTSGFPTIRGVMHAAGVLWDGTVETQSWATFQHTYKTKVDGSWNLHELTNNLPLEHFVFFSSMAATMGSRGQANHCASNSFEDALAHYRKFKGLPATTVNWANWGEVGVATEIDFPGLSPISTAQGLLALETFLRTQITHAEVANVGSFALVPSPYPGYHSVVDDKRLFSGESKYNNAVINPEEFWSQVVASEGGLGRLEVFKELVKNILRNMLKMEDKEVINENAEFHTLGVDSLMMLEMRNAMQNVFGSRIPLTAAQLKDCGNTELLAKKFVSLIEDKM